jgi:hypothetical protein
VPVRAPAGFDCLPTAIAIKATLPTVVPERCPLMLAPMVCFTFADGLLSQEKKPDKTEARGWLAYLSE